MKTKSLIFTVLMLFAGTVFGQATEVQDEQLKASAASAKSWLAIVDQGNYGQSWATGALTFKLKIPQNRWVMLMDAVRKPLGAVKERKLIDQRTAKDPKGLPAGDYMVLVYNTSFAKKQNAHELVTMVLESDGVWRVLTYQVQ